FGFLGLGRVLVVVAAAVRVAAPGWAGGVAVGLGVGLAAHPAVEVFPGGPAGDRDVFAVALQQLETQEPRLAVYKPGAVAKALLQPLPLGGRTYWYPYHNNQHHIPPSCESVSVPIRGREKGRCRGDPCG